MQMILLMVAMFAIMYFLMIRPQQKKMRKDQEMRSQLTAGERVLLTSGIFGTIAHVGERQMIVELAPGVEITILKGNVARAVTAEDEEFEFTDEVEDEAPAQPEIAALGTEFDTDGAADSLQPSDFFSGPTEPTPAADEASADEAASGEAPGGYQPWERDSSGNGTQTPDAEDNK